MQDKLNWCFGLKDGLKIIEPNENLARKYLEEAKLSLKRADKNFEDKDMLWSTIVAYYAEYYSLYSFLQRIGIKCENHLCSILAVELVLGKEKTKIIISHKDKRIDAQYYMRIDKEEQIKQMLKEAKIFVLEFEELVLNLSNNDIIKYQTILKRKTT